MHLSSRVATSPDSIALETTTGWTEAMTARNGSKLVKYIAIIYDRNDAECCIDVV